MSLSLFSSREGFEIVGSRNLSTDNKNPVRIIKANIDPSQVGVDAPKGSLLLRTDNGSAYIKTSAFGDPTGWSLLLKSSDVSNEDIFQNAFIGKDNVGNLLPQYSSTNVVSNSDSLKQSIEKLDTKIGANFIPENRANNQLSASNTLQQNISLLDKAIGGNVTSNYFVSINKTVNQNISALDEQVKINTDQINSLTNGISWRTRVVVITADNELRNASEGTLLQSVLPFSDDTGNVIDINTFSVGDYLISENGATTKLWRVGPGFVLTLNGFDPIDLGDTFFVRYDLLDNLASQKNNAIYTFNGNNIVKMSDVDWQVATGIDISSAYTPNFGNVSIGDSVEKAIEKIEGTSNNLVSLTGVSKGSLNLGTFDNGSIISDNNTIKGALNDLDIDVTKIRTTIGTPVGSSNMGSYSGYLLTANKSIKENIQELENEILNQCSRFSVIASGSGTSTTINSVNLSATNAISVIWKVIVLNGNFGRYMSTITALVNSTMNEVDFNEFSVLFVGVEPNISFDVTLNSGNLNLVITNNETNSVTVKITREIIY